MSRISWKCCKCPDKKQILFLTINFWSCKNLKQVIFPLTFLFVLSALTIWCVLCLKPSRSFLSLEYFQYANMQYPNCNNNKLRPATTTTPTRGGNKTISTAFSRQTMASLTFIVKRKKRGDERPQLGPDPRHPTLHTQRKRETRDRDPKHNRKL